VYDDLSVRMRSVHPEVNYEIHLSSPWVSELTMSLVRVC
jgi:hypothetical protein